MVAVIGMIKAHGQKCVDRGYPLCIFNKLHG